MVSKPRNASQASLHAETDRSGDVTFRLSGRLDSANTPALWRQVKEVLAAGAPTKVIIEAAQVDYCDGTGLGLLLDVSLHGLQQDFEVEIRELPARFEQLLNMFDVSGFRRKHPKHKPINIAEEVGVSTVHLWGDIRRQTAFIGRLCAAMVNAVVHPLQIRWRDAFWIAEQVGANAVGIISLIGFLFGLILAFSSAMPLRQFGADIYVADLVAIALVRVLGPFITAIILAGRSGSAFAAELGTMKINDEIDALEIMGLDPVRFLVVPRVFAGILMAPLLTILTNLTGLMGSAIVMLSLGFPLVTYMDHVRGSIDTGDVLAGLFKSLVYGGLIGAVGCLRGLQTRTGASAVGISTTRAVVSGIVLVVIAEGIFAVLYYCLGI